MNTNNLQGKVAIVTGASRGIGKSITRYLADEKMKLVLTSKSRGLLEKLRHELPLKPKDILVIAADLQEDSATSIIIEKTAETFGGIDVLINNAGIAVSKEIENTSVKDWDKLMNVNAKAPFFLTRNALKYLRESDVKHIINIGSVVDSIGYINQAAYAASKHALLGFSKVLAKEVQRYNIKLNVISPGGVDTHLVSDMRPDINKAELIAPKEISELVIFLLKQKGNAAIDQIKIRRNTKTPWA